VIISTFKYGLITHFKYPEFRLFTCSLWISCSTILWSKKTSEL